MASIKEITTGEAGRIRKADPRAIIVEKGFNHRLDFGDIEAMADSIEANHVKTPLEVIKRGDSLVLNDGERRLRGSLRLIERGGNLDWVPVIVVPDEGRAARLITQFVKNDGKPFTPIEESQLFSELRKGDPEKGLSPMSVQEIAKSVGKSVSHVADRLLLCEADETLLKLLEDKKIGTTLVTEAVKTSKAGGASTTEAAERQRAIAKVARTDKDAAKKMAVTDAKGAFYMRKSDQDAIRAAVIRAENASNQEDLIEEARQAGVIMGICQLLGAKSSDLESLKIDISAVRFVEW